MRMKLGPDTGLWSDRWGEVFHIIQREDGSVTCNGAKTFTAANALTWEEWKRSGWKKLEKEDG